MSSDPDDRRPRVELRDLRVQLGRATVLDGVSLCIAPGEWVTVVGPNGAGKSTMLRALVGLASFEGTIAIDGDTTLRGLDRARRLAFVPQSPVIPTGVHVIDYVGLGRVPHRGAFAAETAAGVLRIEHHLETLDLLRLSDRTVTSLSGGERQRVVIARALAQEADILLLDEPTTALDIGHQQELLRLVEQLRTTLGVTVVLTAHDLTLAGRFGSRLVMLDQGRIVADGSPSAVLTADRIRDHYGADVRILHDDDGPIVVPAVGQ